MGKIFFSVIIPTLDEEKFLPSLLECLLRQKFRRFEIIVVDGKSADGTVAAAREKRGDFKKKGIRLSVVESEKRNVSYQRNLGARKSKGKYLIFFDADVEIGKDFVGKVYRHIEKEESVLLTTWLVPDSEDVIDELMVLLTNYGIEIAKHTKKAFLPGFNIVVERNIFWAIGGFDEKAKMSEDHQFIQRARKQGIGMRFLKEPSLTVSLRRFRREGRIGVLRKYMRALTHLLLKGSVKDIKFDYPMGGSYHLKKRRKSLLDRLRGRFGWE